MEAGFKDDVKNCMWDYISSRYHYSGRSANGSEREPFWPGVEFHEVAAVENAAARSLLDIVFSVQDYERKFRFRIDLGDAVERWQETGVAVDLSLSPHLIANDLLWFFVCFAGRTRFDQIAEDGNPMGTQINRGDESFRTLPEWH